MTILEVEDLTVAFGDHVALKDISFAVSAGEVFTIFGGSGCGKSLLFSAITGLLAPTGGTVKLFDQNIHRLAGHQWTQVQQRIGTALYGGALLKSLSVLENIKLPLIEIGGQSDAEAEERAMSLLRRMHLRNVARLLPKSLSRGEVQRVGLARALALRPEILICDDVLAGLDWRTREDLVGFLEELRQSIGLAVVLFTPLPELCFRMADRMAILNAGEIIATGTPGEIENLDDPVIEDVFLSQFEAMRQFGRGATRNGPEQVGDGGAP